MFVRSGSALPVRAVASMPGSSTTRSPRRVSGAAPEGDALVLDSPASGQESSSIDVALEAEP